MFTVRVECCFIYIFLLTYFFYESSRCSYFFNYKNIDFIAAGGLSINDLKTYKSLGYKAVVIGDKAIKNKKFDPKIYEWLKNN